MAGHREQQPENFQLNPFTAIGKDWMLVCAANAGKTNAMTAAWGGFGVMWNKEVVFVVIRPQRYTKEFVDSAESFSLTFFDESFKKDLAYLGKISGRDEDKIAKTDLTVAKENGVPYFAEAETAIFAKKLFAQPIEESAFIDKSIIGQWYEGDYHHLYIAEVTGIMKKEI